VCAKGEHDTVQEILPGFLFLSGRKGAARARHLAIDAVLRVADRGRRESVAEAVGAGDAGDQRQTTPMVQMREEAGGVRVLQFVFPDSAEVDLTLFVPAALDFLDEARRAGRRVLVHCHAGHSRSVALLLAYLLLRCDMSLREGWELVRARRSCVHPRACFVAQLAALEKAVRGAATLKSDEF
jgi:predicted protein tyrosine phosphatase